jgi:hypothetical protein
MTETPPDKPSRDPSAYLLLHTFLGPVFGVVFVLIAQISGFAILGSSSPQMRVGPPDLAAIFVLFLVVVLPGWFFGFIPALLHAVLMLLLRRIVPSRNLWLLLTPFIGALAVLLLVLPFGGTTSNGHIVVTLAGAGLTGSAAAVCCQAIAWRRRMYPVFND